VEPYGIFSWLLTTAFVACTKYDNLLGNRRQAAGGRWALPLRPAGQQPGNRNGQTATWLVSGRSERTAGGKKLKKKKVDSVSVVEKKSVRIQALGYIGDSTVHVSRPHSKIYSIAPENVALALHRHTADFSCLATSLFDSKNWKSSRRFPNTEIDWLEMCKLWKKKRKSIGPLLISTIPAHQ
jgi:hypothetical protein